MEKTYNLSGVPLLVVFNSQIVQLRNPKDLKKFLSSDIENRSEILVNYIKQDYFLHFGSELDVSNDSMIVEIWGHVFASQVASAVKKLIRLDLVEDLADFVLKRSDVIDCGESEVDLNRSLWDLLANLKGVIVTFLPKKLK